MLPWWVWVGAIALCVIIAAGAGFAMLPTQGDSWSPQEGAQKPQGPAAQALASLDYNLGRFSTQGHPPTSLYHYLAAELNEGRMEASWVTQGDFHDLASEDSPAHYNSTVNRIRSRITRAAAAE